MLDFTYFIAIGLITGLLAHFIFRKSGISILTNMITGIVGTFIGFIILAYFLDLSLNPDGIYSEFLAFVGAIIGVSLLNLLYKSTH